LRHGGPQMTPSDIKKHRLSYGFNQAQFAPLIGYADAKRVGEAENGRVKPHPAIPLLIEAYEAGYRPAKWPRVEA
jgi:DNA-binding transcriptional regulator YiaG